MLRALGLLLVITWIAPDAFAHDDNILDPHNATPGVRLELVELPRATATSPIAYRLRLTGAARDLEFELWTQDFGALFRKVASGFRADEEGNVVSAKPGKAGQGPMPITVRPGPFPQGAAWAVALVSADKSIRAFAAAIPRPMVSRNGACMLELELVSYKGDRFVATGTGFVPGDEVAVESRVAGRTIDKRKTISVEGRLPTDVIVYDAVGATSEARYAVTGRFCAVAIDYRWGKRALSRR